MLSPFERNSNYNKDVSVHLEWIHREQYAGHPCVDKLLVEAGLAQGI